MERTQTLHTVATTPDPTPLRPPIASVPAATVAAPTLPTNDDVDALAYALDRDGFGPHEAAVAHLAMLARQVDPSFASLAVIVDRSAAEVARSRSFGALAGRWRQHRQILQERRDRFDQSFEELRSAWLDHDRIRRAKPAFDELWRSRTTLDQNRAEVARRRREAFGDVGPALAHHGA